MYFIIYYVHYVSIHCSSLLPSINHPPTNTVPAVVLATVMLSH